MAKIDSVDSYIQKHSNFSEALTILRDIIMTTELNESIKWSAPVYDLDGKNVLGLGAFKNHFGIWFFNGVFLKDDQKLLVNAQEKTKALRQMRFSDINDINVDIVKTYVKEAIQNQKLGKEIKPERNSGKIKIPSELQKALDDNSALQKAFDNLTPGKQREYYSHIESAKRDATKLSRIEKIKPMILDGKGLYDKYKNC